MVIDVHVHPTGYSLISQDPEERAFRTRVFQKKVEQDHSPIAMTGKPSGSAFSSGGISNRAMTKAPSRVKLTSPSARSYKIGRASCRERV